MWLPVKQLLPITAVTRANVTSYVERFRGNAESADPSPGNPGPRTALSAR